jgi:hypothetical protein
MMGGAMKARILSLALVVALALLAAPPSPAQPKSGAAAPEITGSSWINSEPLTIGGLRGRVVLVEFWTYG